MKSTLMAGQSATTCLMASSRAFAQAPTHARIHVEFTAGPWVISPDAYSSTKVEPGVLHFETFHALRFYFRYGSYQPEARMLVFHKFGDQPSL